MGAEAEGCCRRMIQIQHAAVPAQPRKAKATHLWAVPCIWNSTKAQPLFSTMASAPDSTSDRAVLFVPRAQAQGRVC